MDGTILGQGTFISQGVAEIIQIPSGVDFLKIYNFTESAAAVTGPNGFEFYWQLGMGSQGIVKLNTSGIVTVDQTAAGAFVLFNPGNVTLNPAVALTGFTAANPGVVTTGSTATLAPGAIVVFTGLDNQPQYGGIPFTVGIGTLTGTTFSVDYLNSTGSTPSTAGKWTLISYAPLFQPNTYFITNITAASSAVITLSVQHGLSIGQQIRFALPGGTSVWGNYAQLDGQQATITAVDKALGVGHNTVTVNYNTTGFGTFAIPAATALPFTPAQLIPFGDYTAIALAQVPPLSSLEDSVQNTGYLGMILSSGAELPAGITNDVIYWVAGKSTYGGS